MAMSDQRLNEKTLGDLQQPNTEGEHGHDLRAASRRRLWITMALTGSYMLVEVVGGLMANSLALLADAGHMVADAAAIGLALFAMWMAGRPASSRHTFGFQRAEIVAASLSALSLVLVAGWIFLEAYRRFQTPSEVQGLMTLSIGSVGLLVNVLAAMVLKHSAAGSLNVEAAFLHVVSDLLGSIGVVVAGLLIMAFGWFVADPVFGAIIGLLIMLSSGRLLWKVLRVLLEGTPSSLDLQRLCQRLEQVESVTGVHDIHAWSITTGYEVFSAHVTADVPNVEDASRLLQHLRDVAAQEFGITHITIQLESSSEGCEESHHVAHPA
ncbi:MAG: hypothetical protein HW388_845 [Dehalococcoidia bacterium]|nr:hypothetical protein [Dehalococcoidia bacterium]